MQYGSVKRTSGNKESRNLPDSSSEYFKIVMLYTLLASTLLCLLFDQAEACHYTRSRPSTTEGNIAVRRLQSSDLLLLLNNPIKIPSEEKLPQSVDLREYGLMTPVRNQGKCGSCWAFATVAAFESCILYDGVLYSHGSPFGKHTDLLHISEQFEIVSSASNNFCSSGNIVRLINDHLMGLIPTIEVDENFPYTLADSTESDPPISPPQPILSLDDYVLPIYSEPKLGYKAGVIILYNRDAPYNSSVARMVETYLSLGVPVMATINTWADGRKSHRRIKQYRDGILSAQCHNASLDHEVLIVGYGRYRNTAVWIVRNSWGADWGVQGYAYVARGSDSYCLERSAIAVLPRTLDPTAEYAPFFEHPPPSPLLLPIYEGIITRCENGLDSDSPQGCSAFARSTPPALAIVLTLVFATTTIWGNLLVSPTFSLVNLRSHNRVEDARIGNEVAEAIVAEVLRVIG